MEFAIIAYDGTDDEAVERRLKVRDRHVALGDELVRSGNGLLGGAIIGDEGKMVGSIKIVDFPSRAELDEYLASEPYVTGDVWKEIQVLPFRVGPSYRRSSTVP